METFRILLRFVIPIHFFLFSFLLPAFIRAEKLADSRIHSEWAMTVGEQRMIKVQGLHRYSLSSHFVRGMRPSSQDPERILLKATSPGMTTLWIWKKDGSTEMRSIRVLPWKENLAQTSIQKTLSLLNEAEVFWVGEQAVLRGVIGDLKELTLISDLVRRAPQTVVDETIASEELIAKGLRGIESFIQSTSSLRSLTVERRADELILLGTLAEPSLVTPTLKKIRTLYPKTIFDWDTFIDGAGTVFFRVFLLELKKDSYRNLGLEWPGKIEGAFQVRPFSIQGKPDLSLGLNLLEGEGRLKILSNPELAVRVPGEAELFAGGEIPIRNQGRFFSNVAWKNYGLTLKLKVTEAQASAIRLEIQTEMSHLDTTHAAEGVPGLRTSKMRSQVDAKLGRPLFLSGLLQNGFREMSKGLPFLKSIPILGSLFQSEEYQNERSELVAILFPHRAPPPAPIEKVASPLPRGPVPAPRNRLTSDEQIQLKQASQYPWNALE